MPISIRTLVSLLVWTLPVAWQAGIFFGSNYTVSSGAACGNGFVHCRQITWDHTQAGTADSATFVGLVNATEADWATSANGGAVQNTVNQSGGSYTSTIPADFIFTSDSACTTAVAGWEFESYTSTTGALIVWVNIGTLSHTTNTSVWACYDKASVTTQQATVSSTWDTNYVGVWHFAGTLSLSDSTVNANTLTNAGAGGSSGTGQFGNGVVLNGTEGGPLKSAFSVGANIVTAEAWCFSSTMTTQAGKYLLEHDPVNTEWQLFDSSGTLVLRGGDLNNDLNGSAMSNSTWTSIAGTITGTSGAAYVQGAATTGTVTAFTDTSNQFSVGQQDGGGSLFTGSMDEVRISKTARAASYFTARYNQEKASQTMVTIGAEN